MHGVEFGAGTVFAGYRIERLLGRGGMGTVYLAAHPRLPRQVALKLLNRELSSDPEVRGRFEREADVSAHLDHPGIVSVLDRGVEDGLMWISMQYVDGTDASVFRGAPVDPARAIDIVAQTAEALDYAHERGVLHRDVKPANILLAAARTGDRVLLTDFGIARLRGDARQLTRTGAFLATLAYASPEQLSGASVDHRSDQYSLGCTLFTLLTGESPFPADNPGAVVAAHLSKPVPRASATVSTLPPGIDAVIARALAKDPAERFGSCAEFAQAAVAALGGATRAPAQASTPGPGHSAPQRPGTRPEPSSMATLVAPSAPQPPIAAGPGWNAAPRGYGPHPGARTAPPRTAVSSRWRALAVTLLVLGMVAGVGVVGVGAIYWKFVRPSRIAPPPVASWGEHRYLYNDFSQMLPKDPTATGWSDSQCFATGALVVQPGDPVPVRQITCTDSQGVTSWYTEYATAADADAYLDRHATADPSTTRGAAVGANATVTAWRPRAGEPFTLAVRRAIDGVGQPAVVEVSAPGGSFESTQLNWYLWAPL
ncbi:protein kinase domain-containing protein [Nocardia sp. MW-W600-9]